MKKKSICFFIMTSMVISCLSSSAIAVVKNQDQDIYYNKNNNKAIIVDSEDVSNEINSEKKLEDQTIENLKEFIIQLYYLKDIGKEQNLLKTYNLNTDIYDYIVDKIETQQYVTKLYDTEKENYKVEVELIDKNFDNISNIVSFDFQVVTTYNYIGREFDTSCSEVVKILYDYNKAEIIDCYTPMNYYDEYVRGNELTLNEMGFRLDSFVADKQNNIIDEININYSNLNQNQEKNDNEEYKNLKNSATLDSIAIVNWARNNYYKDQPASGNGSIAYYDFSEISGNYDCTNFVSHALLAGGAKINDTGGSGISSKGWYYRSLNNRSSSWSGVEQLYNYMITNEQKNTAAGMEFMYTLNGAYWGIGNVMQFRFNNNSRYSHSTIITIKERSSDGARCYAYVTGRTGDNRYNNNQAASDMAPVGTQRVIAVYNKLW